MGLDLLTAFNFLEIQNAKDADRAARKLDDLKDEAEHLQKKGVHVKSWHEFKREVVQESPDHAKNIAIYGGAGAAIFSALAIFTPLGAAIGIGGTAAAVSGGLLGGMLGGYKETENSQHLNKVDAYENYLQLMENAHKAHSRINEWAQDNEIDIAQLAAAPSSTVSPEIIAANQAPEKKQGCGCQH